MNVIATHSGGACSDVAMQSCGGRSIIATRHSTPLLIAAGLRGAKGEPGAATPRVPFAYGDASPMLVHIVAEDTLLFSLQLSLTTPFDGEEAALRVRTNDGQILMDTSQVSPKHEAVYETTYGAVLVAGTVIYLDITPGAGPTAGSGFLTLNFN